VTQNNYAAIKPFANYAPWMSDAPFLETWRAIAGYTLVDLYRCYELWTLVEQCQKLSGSILEVGVWRGGTAAVMAHRARLLGMQATVYLCDTFRGVVKAGAADGLYRGGEHADTSQAIVEQLVLQRFRLNNVRILPGIFPEETGGQVSGESFRLCHIDVDVYESAKDILEWLWPRLVVGGVVVFDDYGFDACVGVTRLVNEQRACADRLVIHNLNGHGLLIKISAVPPASNWYTVSDAWVGGSAIR